MSLAVDGMARIIALTGIFRDRPGRYCANRLD